MRLFDDFQRKTFLLGEVRAGDASGGAFGATALCRGQGSARAVRGPPRRFSWRNCFMVKGVLLGEGFEGGVRAAVYVTAIFHFLATMPMPDKAFVLPQKATQCWASPCPGTRQAGKGARPLRDGENRVTIFLTCGSGSVTVRGYLFWVLNHAHVDCDSFHFWKPRRKD